jgi:hypothetical protein
MSQEILTLRCKPIFKIISVFIDFMNFIGFDRKRDRDSSVNFFQASSNVGRASILSIYSMNVKEIIPLLELFKYKSQ